jgi:hypothetical protein
MSSFFAIKCALSGKYLIVLLYLFFVSSRDIVLLALFNFAEISFILCPFCVNLKIFTRSSFFNTHFFIQKQYSIKGVALYFRLFQKF